MKHGYHRIEEYPRLERVYRAIITAMGVVIFYLSLKDWVAVLFAAVVGEARAIDVALSSGIGIAQQDIEWMV